LRYFDYIGTFKIDQSLVGSVVIGAELDREAGRLEPGGGWNHLISELTPEPN
jgi:hypothetical protein